MQWGQIKTIFIICFLVLDVYLLTQVLGKENDSMEITDPETASIEDELKERKINYDKVPKEPPKATYISATWHSFDEEELSLLEDKGQKVAYSNGMIYAEFEKPILISEESSAAEITEFIKPKILYGDQYTFYNWNKQENVLIFFQQYENQPIFYNNGSLLLVFLNENNEITGYFQAMQGEIGPETDVKEVSNPLDIVEVLLNENKLYDGDTISSMQLGYHTFWPVGGVQAFVPAWKISVNENERIYYVNALDGRNITINETKFITDIKENSTELKTLLENEKENEKEEEIESEPGSEES